MVLGSASHEFVEDRGSHPLHFENNGQKPDSNDT
ncbi:hypothetical protein MNBD_GAMMA09-647 [hydrothermal vent metagenome]|uniref:Uncharacterized protein n=1 Tax=hydrothermal vent metagenome TaxID=652676 RepID=A0A3B0Y0U5_9ZZZZ